MLIIGSILLLLAYAVTLRREKSIFNRVAILILLYSGILAYDSLAIGSLDTGIGVFSGLFHSTAITHSFYIFIYIIGHTSASLRLQSSLHYSRYKHMTLGYLFKVSAAPFQIFFILSALGLFGFGFIDSFSYEFGSFSDLMSSVLIYSPADEQKKEAIKENRKKSGVYKWTNLTDGNSYVGSSVDLGRRFSMYYSEKVLIKELKKINSHIYRALLKYGHSKFSLEIIEYCEAEEVVTKEQYYIDLLDPEYNICPIAGSSLLVKFQMRHVLN